MEKKVKLVNLAKLGSKLSTTSDQVKFCQEHKILPTEVNCDICNTPTSTVQISGNKSYFRCCQKKYNLRKNTILENSKMSLRKFILMLYCFVTPTFTCAQVQEETSITSDEESEADQTTSKTTVNKYYTMLRHMICDEMLVIGKEKIGGVHKTV